MKRNLVKKNIGDKLGRVARVMGGVVLAGVLLFSLTKTTLAKDPEEGDFLNSGPNVDAYANFCQAELPGFNFDCKKFAVDPDACDTCSEYRYCLNTIRSDKISAVCKQGNDWMVLKNLTNSGFSSNKDFCDSLGIGATNDDDPELSGIYWQKDNKIVQPNADAPSGDKFSTPDCYVDGKELEKYVGYNGYTGCIGQCLGEVGLQALVAHGNDGYLNFYFTYANEQWVQFANGGKGLPFAPKSSRGCSESKTCIQVDVAKTFGDVCADLLSGTLVQGEAVPASLLNGNYSVLLDNNNNAFGLGQGVCVFPINTASVNNLSQTCMGLPLPQNSPSLNFGGKNYFYVEPNVPNVPTGIYAARGDNCLELRPLTGDQFCTEVLGGKTENEYLQDGKPRGYQAVTELHPGAFTQMAFVNDKKRNCYLNPEVNNTCEFHRSKGENVMCLATTQGSKYSLTNTGYTDCPVGQACYRRGQCGDGGLGECVAANELGAGRASLSFLECPPGPKDTCAEVLPSCDSNGSLTCKSAMDAVGSLSGSELGSATRYANCPNNGFCVTKNEKCTTQRKQLADCCMQNVDDIALSAATGIISENDFNTYGAIANLMTQGIRPEGVSPFSHSMYDTFFSTCQQATDKCTELGEEYNDGNCTEIQLPPEEPKSDLEELIDCCDEAYSISTTQFPDNDSYIAECKSRVESEVQACNASPDYDRCISMVQCRDKINEYDETGGYTFNPADPLKPGDYFDPLGTDESLASIISRAVNGLVFPIAIIILFVMLIWGGVAIIAASATGQQNKIDMGKKRITAAIIGFVILFVAYWLLQLIETIFGLGVTGVAG